MKILLIAPKRSRELHIPLGLGYLASYLRENGFLPTILDSVAEAPSQHEEINSTKKYGLYDAEIIHYLKQNKPDLIGITSNFTSHHDDAIRMSRICKSVYSSVPIVIGGAHPTSVDREVLLEESIDIVVRGEGEVTLLEVCKAYATSDNLANVKGITYRNEGRTYKNPDRDEIQELDTLPMPAYDLMRMDAYLGNQWIDNPYVKNFPVGVLFTSRGCPFRCTFCTTHYNWKNYRWHSAERVLEEILFLKKHYGIKEIQFLDDSFITNKERARNICELLIDASVNISWGVTSGVQAWVITKELLRLMNKSGFYRINLPIETGNVKSLKYINKPINLEKSKELIKECNQIGIWTYGNFIIGFPEETREDIINTLDYIYNSGLDSFNLFIAQPLPGSKMHDDFEKLGLLNNTQMVKSNYYNTMYNTVHMKAEELNEMRKMAVHNFVKSRVKACFTTTGFKQFIFPKINSVSKLRYFLTVIFSFIRLSLKRKRLTIFEYDV